MQTAQLVKDSHHLLIRHLQPDDYDAVWEYISDPLVAKYLTWDYYQDAEAAKTYFNRAVSLTSFPDECLAIVDAKTQCVIGTIHLIFRDTQVTQFGFGVISRLWKLGYGSQAVVAALQYIKMNQNWSKYPIQADVHVDNQVAIAILQKCGFTLHDEGVEKNRDRYLYAQHI
jgi:RimJ/RimL family protein N-acetyltransferase